MRAKAKNARKPHEMTKAEKAFAACDWLWKDYDNVRYEAFTLRSGQTRYTPDFCATDRESGQVVFFEVKASGHRAAFTDAAKLKIKQFAHDFPEYVFFVAWPDKTDSTGWRIDEIDNHA